MGPRHSVLEWPTLWRMVLGALCLGSFTVIFDMAAYLSEYQWAHVAARGWPPKLVLSSAAAQSTVIAGVLMHVLALAAWLRERYFRMALWAALAYVIPVGLWMANLTFLRI